MGDRQLIFDDYSGNNLYMTLGNIHSNPVAGLLFVNYETGDLLQLSCSAEIIESSDKNMTRQIKLTLDYGWMHKSALDIEWEFIYYSRFL